MACAQFPFHFFESQRSIIPGLIVRIVGFLTSRGLFHAVCPAFPHTVQPIIVLCGVDDLSICQEFQGPDRFIHLDSWKSTGEKVTGH